MDYRSLRKKREEITDKYAEVLHLWRYQDIHVKQPSLIVRKISTTDFTADIYDLNIYFWDNNYGYSFCISVNPRGFFDDSVVFEYDKIVDFLADSNFLKKANISECFSEHLKANGFGNTHILPESTQNCTQIVAYKNELTWSLSLTRVDTLNEDIASIIEDSPLLESIAPDFNSLRHKFDNQLKTCEFEITSISSNLKKVSVTIPYAWLSGQIEVYCYSNNLLEDIACNSCIDIVRAFSLSCLLEYHKNKFLQYLQEQYHFHVHHNIYDVNSVFLYKEGKKYKITTHFEKPKIITTQQNRIFAGKNRDFDHMDGHDFERFCADILLKNDFERISVTRGSGDQGIDIIAFKDGIKYGIQCKCYSSDISNKAVQEVFAGKTFYECHVGVVLTNQHFTKSAIELAKKNGVLLWDRKKLIELSDKAFNNDSVR